MKSFLLFLILAGGSWAGDATSARIFIWQERIRGLRANPVFVDGVEVASLRKRWTYFVVEVPAGEHTFNGRHKENELVLQLKPGEDCYLRLDQILTVPGGEKLVRTSAAEVKLVRDSGKLQPVSPDDVRDYARVIFSDSRGGR